MSKVEEQIKIKEKNKSKNTAYFARHETFHPRFGWLKKGFDKAKEDKYVFTKDEAPVVLGVGKNMVRAIRYWCFAFKLIDDIQNIGKEPRRFEPTDFGEKLLGIDGWDPYLENPDSLWLLHWVLLNEPCYATAWYYFFNVFRQMEFTVEDVVEGLEDYKELYYSTSQCVKSSLKKDVTCILRMYSEHKVSKDQLEDSINSPFVELGLIKQTSEAKYYTFNVGKKLSLPDELIVYACLDFAASVSREVRSINISRLLYDEGSPGLVFKLTQGALFEAIENVSSILSSISLSDTAGVIQFFYDKDPEILAEELIQNYYKKTVLTGGVK